MKGKREKWTARPLLVQLPIYPRLSTRSPVTTMVAGRSSGSSPRNAPSRVTNTVALCISHLPGKDRA